MKIIKLEAENIKKIKAIEITPKDNTVIVSGDNEQGKSSVLDSIWYALQGGTALKGVKEPIRKGQEKGKITIDLGEYIVTRTFKGKNTYLKVENKDGTQFKSPQAILDTLIGDLSFDPLAFTKLDDRGQRETLLKLVDINLDLDLWEKDQKTTYDTRTDTNRNLRQLKSEYEKMIDVPKDTPDEEIDSETLLDELQAIQDNNSLFKVLQQDIQNMEKDYNELKQKAMMLKDKIAESKITLESKKLEDSTEIEEKIKSMSSVNNNIKAKKDKIDKGIKIDTIEKKSQELTEKLIQLDNQKADALKNVVFPVNALGFDEVGVTYKGIPFKQCSAAESLRVSLAMAMALNPELKVLRIMDGSLIGPTNKKIIKEMVKEKDYQVWIEIVDTSGKMGVYIEDGEIKS